jgi:uncharacterized protein YbbC (DUF1343 family)
VRHWALRRRGRAKLCDETLGPLEAAGPHKPTFASPAVYPGMCLVEATDFSEGRGTTRPFLLCGAPNVEPRALAARLNSRALAGVVAVPTFFRPQFQKHRGALCGGVELAVTDAALLASYRLGVEVLVALRAVAPEAFAWRTAPYEFVHDRPAIDLLAGNVVVREALDRGDALDDFVASWRGDELAFRDERRSALLYPEEN